MKFKLGRYALMDTFFKSHNKYVSEIYKDKIRSYSKKLETKYKKIRLNKNAKLIILICATIDPEINDSIMYYNEERIVTGESNVLIVNISSSDEEIWGD